MKSIIRALGLYVAFAGVVLAQNADPMTGTWVLNVAKSNMTGPGTSSSETVVWRVAGDEESFIANAVAANSGEKETTTYFAKYGGPAVPMKSVYIAKDGKQRVENAMVSVIKISDRVRERQVQRDGRPTMRARRVISDDGKTLTASILDKDENGKEVLRSTRVFDKAQ